MVVKAVTNEGDSPMFVGGRMILPACTELVDVLEDAAAEGLGDLVAEALEKVPENPLAVLIERKVSEVVPTLAGLTDTDLVALEGLEQAGKARKGLLAELMAERLKRASMDSAAPGPVQEPAGETISGGGEAAAGNDETDGPVNRDADPVPCDGAT